MSADEILKLIAEGYFDRCEDDRYVIVVNPEYLGGTHWEDPYIVYDTWHGEEDGEEE